MYGFKARIELAMYHTLGLLGGTFLPYGKKTQERNHAPYSPCYSLAAAFGWGDYPLQLFVEEQPGFDIAHPQV